MIRSGSSMGSEVMRRMHWKAWSAMALLLLAVPIVAQQAPINLKAVAILRWYPANLTTTFPVGNFPWGIAFDGANIWVTSWDANSVTKLRASDGANLGTITLGGGPEGIAFDGANIWVANSNVTGGTVTKLRASDGASLGTFNTAGIRPISVAFDGANIWVANFYSDNVTKLRASDGALLGTFAVGCCPMERGF
jgi:DNA-binding beta-propeller fold protein YncE